MVLQVVHGLAEQLLERLLSLAAVEGRSAPRLEGLRGEDPGHLPPERREERQFFLDVALRVGERRRGQGADHADEAGIEFGRSEEPLDRTCGRCLRALHRGGDVLVSHGFLPPVASRCGKPSR